MASSNVCWGIELGAGALKAIKIRAAGDDVELLDFAYIPHKRVLSTPDLDQLEATNLAINALTQQYDLTGAGIAVSVPGHSAFARFAKLPPVDPRKIKDIVKFEAVQQIPFPLEEVEWDYQTFQSPDSPDVEVGIFAMTRERVVERLAMWNQVEVTPDIITLSPVAAYNAIAYDLRFSEKTPGTVILDVGTTSTDLVVAEAGRVWIRTFPIGGHQFTEALVNAFKLTYPKAEKLKREAESSKHARHVFQAMRPVFSDLAQDVQRSIGYYQSLHRDANLTRLIGLGSTFSIPGLKKYLSQQLQMEVIQLESFQRLKADGPRGDEFRPLTNQFATAYGLALQGIGNETINANLVPAVVAREAMWRRKIKWFAAAAGLAVVASGAAFIKPVTDRARVESRPKPAIIDQVKHELESLKRDWNQVEGSASRDLRGANALALFQGRDVFGWIANDFGEMMADAQRKARDAGAKEGSSQAAGFIFERLDARYLSGAGAGASQNSDFEATTRRPPRRSVRGAQSTGRDDGAQAVSSGESGPRIQLILEVATSQADPERFVSDTLRQWINANSTRDGAPYTLKFIKWEKVIDEAAAASPPPRPDRMTPPGSDVFTPPARPGGILVGGTPGAAPSPQAIAMQLDSLAPLPEPPARVEAGAKLTTFQVFFEAILTKPDAQPENPA